VIADIEFGTAANAIGFGGGSGVVSTRAVAMACISAGVRDVRAGCEFICAIVLIAAVI
jgi:hypothetical protein